MAKKTKEVQGDKNLGNIESALTKTELFIEDNQKMLTNILLGILAVALLIIAGNRYILKPKNQEAAASMYMAERFFERDSFNLALNGYGTYPGFLQITEDYGSLGDAYSETGDYSKAVKAYLEAANQYENEFSTPIILKKAGIVYEAMGEFEKALGVYERIQNEYPESTEGREMKKYIGRVQAELASA